jgi:hypothetical protein
MSAWAVRRVFLAALGCGLGWWAAEARAGQPGCAPIERVRADLRQQFGEVPVAAGLSDRGLVVTIFASPAGTWTAVVVRPDGLACQAAAGEGWQALAVGDPA